MNSARSNFRPDWMAKGACRGKTAVFFPARGRDVRSPCAICDECVVKKECLEYALKLHDVVGVWGGTSGKTRRRMRRERVESGDPIETTTVGLNIPGSWAPRTT